MGLLVGDLSRGSPEERGRIVDNILDLQPIFSASPLFATIWAMPRDTAFGLVNFEYHVVGNQPAAGRAVGEENSLRPAHGAADAARRQELHDGAAGAAGCRSPFEGADSVDRDQDVGAAAQVAGRVPAQGRSERRTANPRPADIGQIQERPARRRHRCRAHRLAGSGAERGASIAGEGPCGVRQSGPAADRVDRLQPQPRPPGRHHGPISRAVRPAHRNRLMPAGRAPLSPARPSGGTANSSRRMSGPFVHGMACNIDVSDDLEALRQLHQSELRRVNDHLQSPHTIRTAAEIRRYAADRQLSVRIVAARRDRALRSDRMGRHARQSRSAPARRTRRTDGDPAADLRQFGAGFRMAAPCRRCDRRACRRTGRS